MAPHPRPQHSPCLKFLRIALCIATALWGLQARAQYPSVTTPGPADTQTPAEGAISVLPHLGTGPFWLSGQMNFIFQANPAFHAQYSGPSSFRARYNKSAGRILTLYGAMQLGRSTEVLVDGEEAGGLGLSSAVGMAGFVNLDAVRDPTLTGTPYLARAMVHQVFAFGHEKGPSDRGPLSIFSEMPNHRLELRVGKFGITDFFDTNGAGSDSHLQFLNWSVDQNGAYDFTADARGYTWGAMAEYQSPTWGLRFAEALMPGPQNGGPLVWNLRRANTSNVELELHRGPVAHGQGMIRLLGWVNHANMGEYQFAIDQYLAGKTSAPDISAHPLQVKSKYGFGLNMEQNLPHSMTAYARFGWNNGKTETWSFTEIDQTVSGGVGVQGNSWKRNNDRCGIAFSSNGISSVHARYLALGGVGSVLGDGALRYGRENLGETYYTLHLWRGFFAGPDLQYIVNPGYNQQRGPIFVGTFRVHVEL